jgi:hypothetical protein
MHKRRVPLEDLRQLDAEFIDFAVHKVGGKIEILQMPVAVQPVDNATRGLVLQLAVGHIQNPQRRRVYEM